MPSKLKSRLRKLGLLEVPAVEEVEDLGDGLDRDRRRTANGREIRRLTELNWLSFRPRLRSVTLPSVLIRSCGVFAGAPGRRDRLRLRRAVLPARVHVDLTRGHPEDVRVDAVPLVAVRVRRTRGRGP